MKEFKSQTETLEVESEQVFSSSFKEKYKALGDLIKLSEKFSTDNPEASIAQAKATLEEMIGDL